MPDPRPDPGALLSRWIESIEADDVLVVDVDHAETGATVARSTRKFVRFVSTHWGVHKALLEAGFISRFGIDMPPEAAQGAVVFLAKGKERVQVRLEAVASWLPDHAPLWLIGPKRGGAASARPLLERYAAVEGMESGKHCKLVRAWALHGEAPTPLADLASVSSLERGGRTLQVVSFPGVFGHGGLDDGTAMLLDTLDRVGVPTGRVLDVGAGTGVVGAWLASCGAEVCLTDVDAYALEACRRTLAVNRLEGPSVVASDALEDVEGVFEAIVSNPPFHTGFSVDHGVTERLVERAPDHLVPGGTLTLVVNRFLPVPGVLERVFGGFEVLAEDGRYRVYRATLSDRGAAGRR